MNWRQFKEQPSEVKAETEGFKCLKGYKGGEGEDLKPLRPLKPVEVKIKIPSVIEEVTTLPEAAVCFCCHGSDFWNSASTGDLICRKCHPPAVAKLERIEAAFPTVATEEELMEMIRDTYAELDSLRDWTGWRKSLTGEQQRHLIGIETRIDATYEAFDRKALTMALSDYRAARYQGNPLRHITLGGK